MIINFIRLLKLLLFYAVISLVACSGPGDVAGTGSSTGNAKIGGIIKDKNGNYATNTIVYLIPEGYNPVSHLALPDNFIDTTSSCGRYSFYDHEIGETYNIHAVRSCDNTQLFISGITADQDTVIVPTSTLKYPGNVKVFISDSVNVVGGYIYIPGTMLFTKMNDSTEHVPGIYELMLNSIPAADYSTMYYTQDENPSYNLCLSEAFTVPSSGTVTIGSYSLSKVYNTNNSGLPNDYIYSVAIDYDGSLWFGSDAGEIINFDGRKWTVYDDKVYNFSPVLSIAFEDNGNKWFGTHSGVAGFIGNTWNIYDQLNTGIYLKTVYTVAIDSNGGKWFSKFPGQIETGGIASYNGSAWTEYTYANSGMPSDYAYCMTVDEDQSKWIGTGHGVARLNRYGNWQVYNTYNSGLPCDMIFSIGIDNDGNKWMGTYYGEAVRYDDNYWRVYDQWNSELTGATIHSIAFDSQGNAWFGTADGSLVKFDGTDWHCFNGSNSNIPFYAGPIYGLAVDKYDNIWLTTEGRGVVVFGSEMEK